MINEQQSAPSPDIADLLNKVKATQQLLERNLTRQPGSFPSGQSSEGNEANKDNFLLTVKRLLADPHLIEKMVANGLEVIFICYHGLGSSVIGANDSKETYDMPATFLSGGILTFELATPNKAKDALLNQISLAPWVIVTTPERNLRGGPLAKGCKSSIEEIKKGCERNKTHFVWVDTSAPVEGEYRKFIELQVQRLKEKTARQALRETLPLPVTVQIDN